MVISSRACDGSSSSINMISATYKGGTRAFSEEIRRLIAPIFAKIDLKAHFSKEFNIEGSINEKGQIVELRYVNTFYDTNFSALLMSLYRLPLLEPTLVNGKPVRSGINFKFTINEGLYRYSWQILPLKR